MAPRRSARIVGVASKRTKATAEEEEEVLVVESLRVDTVAVEIRRTETPPKIVKVVPVEETKKKAREEKAKENNDRQRSQEETPTAASEEEQRKKNEEEDANRQMSKEAKETAAPKEEEKGRKKIGKENERKKIRKKKRGGGGEGYRRYVFRVLKQVHPDLRISSMAMAVLNGFMNDMFERVVNEAERLSKYTRKMTLSAWEIRGAVKLVLPGELGKHAVAEGNKAVANY